jgi:hypothetical protein
MIVKITSLHFKVNLISPPVSKQTRGNRKIILTRNRNEEEEEEEKEEE